jgi:hypothetical protein
MLRSVAIGTALACASCGDNAGQIQSAFPFATMPPSADAVAAPSESAVAPPIASATEAPFHIARAQHDTLERFPRISARPEVRAVFPSTVAAILDSPDEVTLLSVKWAGSSNLDALLQGASARGVDAVGMLRVMPEDRRTIVAWLYEGQTRPFEGLRCDSPHHALLFVKGADRIAIAICFECGNFAMRGSGSVAKVGSKKRNVRWDPAFRNFLKWKLESDGIPDFSSDFRP